VFPRHIAGVSSMYPQGTVGYNSGANYLKRLRLLFGLARVIFPAVRGNVERVQFLPDLGTMIRRSLLSFDGIIRAGKSRLGAIPESN